MRKVGLELEVVSDYNINNPSFIYEGVKFKRQDQLHRYNGADIYIVYDGSIETHDYDYSYEFVTRPLDLDKPEDIKVIEVLAKYFKYIDAHVNRTTGFHVHLEVTADDHASFLRGLVKFYAGYQDLLFALNPPSRWNNRYAKILPYNVAERIKRARSLEQIKRAWYGELGDYDDEDYHYNNSRYYILNLHSYFLSGGKHYEIRIHSGTTELKKIMMWVKLNIAIADYVETHKIRVQYFTKKQWMHFHYLRAQFSLLLQKIGLYNERMYFYKRFSKFNNARKNFYKTMGYVRQRGEIR